MSKKIIGELLCPQCPGPQIELGVVNGESVSVPSVLRAVVSRDGHFWVLECGHRAFELQVMASAQEWLDVDGPVISGGPLPL